MSAQVAAQQRASQLAAAKAAKIAAQQAAEDKKIADASAAGDKLFRMTSGNVSGSRWGLRGVEDLGSGMKAVYVLESGFDLDSGVSSQGGRLFGRQAFAGIDHKWGRLTLGRQQNALFDLLINYEPMVLAAPIPPSLDQERSGEADNGEDNEADGTFELAPAGLALTPLTRQLFDQLRQDVLNQARQVLPIGLADHLHIDAGPCGRPRRVLVVRCISVHDHFADRFPVAHDQAAKTPFLAEHAA